VGCAIAWNVGFLLVEGGESSARQNADMGYMEVLTGMANIGVKSSLAECNEDDIGNGASRNGSANGGIILNSFSRDSQPYAPAWTCCTWCPWVSDA